jgi:hypothetical protein
VAPQVRSGRVRKISPPPGFDAPDRPARSESIYGLSCPGPTFRIHISVILLYAATYPEWSLPFVHSYRNFVRISRFYHLCYVTDSIV